MEPLLTFIGPAVAFLAGLMVIVAGVARLRGRRSRFDRAAGTVASAAAMGVYPPSLRGGGVAVPPRPDEPERD